MPGSLLQFISPRGALGRGAYAGVMAGLVAAGFALSRWGVGDGVAGVFCIAFFFALVWVFIAALAKRLTDMGRSRAWICVPLALGLAAFPIGFSLHHSPNVIAGMDPYGKALAVVTIFPVIASAFAQVFAKIAMGVLAMASVWGLFALLLLLPGTKTHV